MPIPVEVVAAWMAMTHPDQFTPDEMRTAEQVLNEWHEVPCAHCVSGWVIEDGDKPKLCGACLGDATVWVRRLSGVLWFAAAVFSEVSVWL